jgi:hypothetical protein
MLAFHEQDADHLRHAIELAARARERGDRPFGAVRDPPSGGVESMAEISNGAGIDKARATLRWWQRWPEWVGYAAAAWSLAYGLLGLWWALGGAGFPFGTE